MTENVLPTTEELLTVCATVEEAARNGLLDGRSREEFLSAASAADTVEELEVVSNRITAATAGKD